MRTLGIERECFIMRNGNISPLIGKLLPKLQTQAIKNSLAKEQFGYELFAAQLEDRTKIVSNLKDLIKSMKQNERLIKKVGNLLNLHFICKDYVSQEELGKLVVNPFDERHQRIWQNISQERKVAACQVASIHIHISLSALEAVKILNYCRKNIIDELSELGDFSQGKRLKAYRTMAEVYGHPPIFKNVDDLMNYIQKHGGERDVWDMVRYKPSTGTIEFRMFGATESYDKIIIFINACQKVVQKVC